MNLKELRNKVKNITDYNPEIQTYLDDLDELINDAYCNVYLNKRWSFANKMSWLDIYPDMEKNTNNNHNCNVTDGRRTVTFGGAITMDDPRDWEGQILELDGRDYTIMKISSGRNIFRLAEPYRGPSDANYDKWKLKYRWQRLPADCLEVLGLAHRDAPIPASRPVHGKQVGLIRRRDEELNLRIDRTSTFSESYILCPPQEVKAAWQFGDMTAIQQAGTNSSAIPYGNYWEFTWAFLHEGRIGALSDPKRVYTGPSEANTYCKLRLYPTTWDDRPAVAKTYNAGIDIYPTPLEGYKKVLFYNSNYDHTTGERKGLPCWRQVMGVGAVTGGGPPEDRDDWLPLEIEDTDTYFEVDSLRQLAEGAPRYIEWEGQHYKFRPYPRPQGFDKEYLNAAASGGTALRYARKFRQFQLRYLQKPERLTLQTDTPQMPYEFHQLIVYSVLFEAFTKSNNTSMAAMYDKKISDSMKTLEKRYVDRADVFWRRGQFETQFSGFTYDYASLRKLN